MSAIEPEIDSCVEEVFEKLKPVLKKAIKEAFRQQMRTRYSYLVGEWAGSKKVKSTKTGSFVKVVEVLKYLGVKEK